MSALELKIPPPLVLVIAALTMLGVGTLVPLFNLSLPGKSLLAVLIAALGVAVAGAGVVAFKRAKTTVNPMRVQTTSALVTGGVYRMSRNPMYLGMLLLLIAWSVQLANAAATLALSLSLFVLYINRFQIAPEEQSLQALFGDAFSAYAKATRRWL